MRKGSGEAAVGDGRARSGTQEPAREPAQAGFSLVELLVVLAIIGMIATMVAPQVLGYLGRAKGETARIQVKNIAQAIELYYLDLGTYPGAQQGLAALLADLGELGVGQEVLAGDPALAGGHETRPFS